jgi:hypothetical protein
METKLNYKVTHQEAWVSYLLLSVVFEYNEKTYTAKADYINGGFGIDNLEVVDDCYDEVVDDDIVKIGEELIYNLEINNNTITW